MTPLKESLNILMHYNNIGITKGSMQKYMIDAVNYNKTEELHVK